MKQCTCRRKWMFEQMVCEHLLKGFTFTVNTTQSLLCQAGIIYLCRLLQPGGMFVGISYGGPRSRLSCFLNGDFGWDPVLYTIERPESTSPVVSQCAVPKAVCVSGPYMPRVKCQKGHMSDSHLHLRPNQHSYSHALSSCTLSVACNALQDFSLVLAYPQTLVVMIVAGQLLLHNRCQQSPMCVQLHNCHTCIYMHVINPVCAFVTLSVHFSYHAWYEVECSQHLAFAAQEAFKLLDSDSDSVHYVYACRKHDLFVDDRQ